VNNAGPYWGNRKLDLAKGAAKRLGFANKGVAKVKVRVLDAPTVAEASYKRNRTYDPLPGYIGQFASTDHAQAALASVAGLESLAKAIGTQETSETVTLASAELPEASQTVAAEASRDGEIGEAKVQPTVRDRGVPLETAAQAEQPKPATLQAASDVGSKKRVQAKSRKSVAGKTPTRAARVAMAKSRLGKRNRLAASSRRTKAGVPARVQSRFLRADGTNDMSVFSRHVRPG
jgi:rare lipoprotein A